MHNGKSKVMTNASKMTGRRMESSIEANGVKYEVLDWGDSTKYLGRKVSFSDPHECELGNRIAAAWGAFSKLFLKTMI